MPFSRTKAHPCGVSEKLDRRKQRVLTATDPLPSATARASACSLGHRRIPRGRDFSTRMIGVEGALSMGRTSNMIAVTASHHQPQHGSSCCCSDTKVCDIVLPAHRPICGAAIGEDDTQAAASSHHQDRETPSSPKDASQETARMAKQRGVAQRGRRTRTTDQ